MSSIFTVAAFYKFINLEIQALNTLQDFLKDQAKQNFLVGTILIAEEGINGAIAGKNENLKDFLDQLLLNPLFKDLDIKFSITDILPFKKLKILIKKEIVTFSTNNEKTVSEIENKADKMTGEYVNPEDWNALITDPEIDIIDTRNSYETKLGTFVGAIDPNTNNFTEFKDFVDKHLNPNQNKKIAMFCTGGIRCEKASAYLLEKGFPKVYQLKGGILKYLENVGPNDSLWQGECFIFDNRVIFKKELITKEC